VVVGKFAILAVAVAFCVGCGQGHAGTKPPDDGGNPNVGPDAGPADSGTPDAGPPAAGPPDAGPPDAGPPDAGPPDAGPPDAGPPDAGPPKFGGPGPWPLTNQIYGAAEGILEQPVVGFTTDETQNLWVATHTAVYLMRPGDSKFTRYGVSSGLHLAGNNTIYCDRDYSLDAQGRADGLPEPDKLCPISDAADAAGISEIVGGGPNEVFVGYYGTHDWNNPNDGTWADPLRHSGMLDRVTLKPDLSVKVDRLQMVSLVSVAFWHNRDVMRMVYDHFKHPHELYVGTNHGVDRFTPDKFTTPVVQQGYPGEETWPSNTYAWMSDHLHPQACSCGPCPLVGEGPLLLGDWRGLAITANGNLLVGGRWAAGKIQWTQPNYSQPIAPQDGLGWAQRQGKGQTPFEFSMGDYYSGGCSSGRPVFCVNREGDVVAISAVTETPDGLQWFASGPYNYQSDTLCADQKTYPNQKNTGDKDLGFASFNPKTGQFAYYSPVADLGWAGTNVRDMLALPDGRIVFASPTSGLTIWDPLKRAPPVSIRASQGTIPSDLVLRLELDTMVNPPALHVATYGGAAVLRKLP